LAHPGRADSADADCCGRMGAGRAPGSGFAGDHRGVSPTAIGVETVRKQELAKAKKDQSQEELANLLHCKQRFILLRNKPSRKKTQVLKRLEELNEPVYKAMLLKEQFAAIYELKDRKAAQPALRAWIGEALRSGLQPFKDLALKLFRKRHYILNFFVRRITSAISEGINNKIKRLKRMAYGYRDVAYFLLKIHQHCGLLNPRRFKIFN